MRIVARLGTGILLASLFAVVGASGPARAAFTARWCSPSVVAPCVQSLAVAGDDVTGSTATHLDFDGPPWWSNNNGGKNLQFFLQGANVGDSVLAVVDLGSHHPDRVSGLQHMTDVDVWQAGSGDWMLRLSGSVIAFARGCAESSWPPVCPSVADEDDPMFEGDVVSGLPSDMVGYYMGSNVENNDISFQTDPSGTSYLETEAYAPHQHVDHSLVVGSMHFRLPYAMLRDDFAIPNPETMTAGSLSGTINSTTASFDIAQDPDGGGIFVDVSGFTFSLKRIRVATGRITPTRPSISSAKRVTPRRGVLLHSFSKARGAKVTRYVARCVGDHSVVTARGSAHSHRIVVAGLHAGHAYKCRVNAVSKAGKGLASRARTLRRR